MTPKYIVYECENCGKLFYREVANVLIDDAEHCDVEVKLIDDEEFPMCGCLGGVTKNVDDFIPSETESY